MNQDQNTSSFNILNDNKESSNINCLSTINTYIENTSSNYNEYLKLINLEQKDSVKKRIDEFKTKKSSLDEIQAIYFDKTIYSLFQRRKMLIKDYYYLFYIFFVKDNYCSYVIHIGHKNLNSFSYEQ